MRLFVLILITCCSLARGNVSVSEVLDAYQVALATAGSISADIESAETFDEKPRNMYLRGLLTLQGGQHPKFRFTGARQLLPRTLNPFEGTSIQAVSNSRSVVVASGSEQAVFESPLAHLGGHLLGAKLDPDFLLLLYPNLLDGVRENPLARVERQTIRNRPCNVLAVEGPNGSFTIQFDAQTHLPARIERVEKTWRGTRLSTLVLENVRVSSRKPPSEIFELSVPPGFNPEAYHPGKVALGDEAPSLLLELESGEFLDLQSRDRPLILFFSADWSEACRNMMPQFHQLAEDGLASGITLIELNIWPTGPSSNTVSVPWLRAGGDRAASLYGVQSLGVPTIVFIDASGVVQEILTGYIPGLTEEAMAVAFTNLAEASSVRPEEP